MIHRATGYRETIEEDDGVDINPFLVFVLLFVSPYLLFYLLLALVTGQTDPQLLYFSVVNESNAALVKAWVIGTFVLSLLGTLWFSAKQTTQYLETRFSSPVPEAPKEEPAHFVIEEHDDSESEGPSSRYARLDSHIDDKDR